MEERQPYGQIKILSMTSVNGMLGPGSLTLETIQQVKPRDETKMHSIFLIIYILPQRESRLLYSFHKKKMKCISNFLKQIGY